VRHPEIVTRTISDERSAAFIALGMARQLRQPVGLVCTSGSAVYNYAPAIAEAYFQQIPLIIFTADRPPEWTDQLDGQTIRQYNIYGQHIKKSYELPPEQNHSDVLWHAVRIVSEAINLSNTYPFGPVHINVPVREPFYPEKDETMVFDKDVKVIRQTEGKLSLSSEVIDQLKQYWDTFQRKIIVCGQYALDPKVSFSLERVSQNQQIPVVADIISNQHAVSTAIKHTDTILAQKDEVLLQSLQPDLLITFGLSVISKNLKRFLRQYPPKVHWHIQPAGEVADTFQALTQIIHTDPATFFDLVSEFFANTVEQKDYFQT
jgi:2-succinyl-5-enolpyruvyl-6-hydroxy-3-cyclohexene-1-carboxylate synthase